jgi:hypothetical protein
MANYRCRAGFQPASSGGFLPPERRAKDALQPADKDQQFSFWRAWSAAFQAAAAPESENGAE